MFKISKSLERTILQYAGGNQSKAEEAIQAAKDFFIEGEESFAAAREKAEKKKRGININTDWESYEIVAWAICILNGAETTQPSITL